MEIEEIWKDVPGYLDIQVSTNGRVKRFLNGKWITKDTFCTDRDGYYKCNIRKTDGSWTQQYVHRLVALTFIDNPEGKTQVNHKNSNRNDNRVENLEWVTPRENCIHSYRFGSRKVCKEVPKRTVLTDYQISQIDTLRAIYSVSEIAKLFNVPYQTMKNVIHKKILRERLGDQQPSNYNSIYD